MSRFPFTRLFLGKHLNVVITGQHIHVIDTKSCAITYSTTSLDGPDKEALLKSGVIRCSTIDDEQKYLITCGDDKVLKVWLLDGLKLQSSRELPKKPTCIQFTRDGQSVIVSDKFGDVFSYRLHPAPSPSVPAPLVQKSKRDALSSHENTSNGILLLGHASLLTTFILTDNEQYVITADRDEHIRVSWYPEGYNIESYCLGHEKYVSAIHIPVSYPSTLISGGGDPSLRIWDWMRGCCLNEVDIFEATKPFIQVKAPKRKRGFVGNGDDDEGQAVERKGRRKKKGKGKTHDQPTRGQETPDRITEANPTGSTETVTEDSGDLVFVVHTIDSFRADSRSYIVFNVVGASAIFVFPFPESPHAGNPDIKYFDFGKPVIDFTLDEENRIWTLLDSEWNADEGISDQGLGVQFVRVVRWDDGKLREISSAKTPLIDCLQSKCIVPATSAELKALDIYSDLSSLPKHVEEDVADDAQSATAIGAEMSEMAIDGPEYASPSGSAAGKKTKPTKRQIGRLKHKQALDALVQYREQQKQQGGSGRNDTADDNRSGDGSERDTKKMRVDEEPVEEQDSSMTGTSTS